MTDQETTQVEIRDIPEAPKGSAFYDDHVPNTSIAFRTLDDGRVEAVGLGGRVSVRAVDRQLATRVFGETVQKLASEGRLAHLQGAKAL